MNEWWRAPDLSTRAQNVLKSVATEFDVLSFEEALAQPREYWIRIPNCGAKTVEEIMTWLQNQIMENEEDWW